MTGLFTFWIGNLGLGIFDTNNEIGKSFPAHLMISHVTLTCDSTLVQKDCFFFSFLPLLASTDCESSEALLPCSWKCMMLLKVLILT